MKPTVDEVQDEIDRAEHEGPTRWSGMSYEEGVSAALRWAIGETDEKPMEDA